MEVRDENQREERRPRPETQHMVRERRLADLVGVYVNVLAASIFNLHILCVVYLSLYCSFQCDIAWTRP